MIWVLSTRTSPGRYINHKTQPDTFSRIVLIPPPPPPPTLNIELREDLTHELREDNFIEIRE